MGKTDLKTACRPWSLRCSGVTSFCRNSSYERFWISIRFGMSMIFLMRPNVRRKRRLFGTRDTVNAVVLIASPARSLQLHAAARLFELLLDRLGLGLRHALLDRLGHPVDQVLRLLEAEPGELAHHLDDLDLLVAGPGEDDREVLLLRRGGRGAAGRGRPARSHRHRGRCRHAELGLELLHERSRVHQAHVLQEVLHLLARHFHRFALPSGWSRSPRRPTRPRLRRTRPAGRACLSDPRAAPGEPRARSGCAGAGPPASAGGPGAAPAPPRARAASRAPSPRTAAAPDRRAPRL